MIVTYSRFLEEAFSRKQKRWHPTSLIIYLILKEVRGIPSLLPDDATVPPCLYALPSPTLRKSI
jgi:hypothetical protein